MTKKPAKPTKVVAAVLTAKSSCIKLQDQDKKLADLLVLLQACI
jgi:hypothetical protein